MAPPRFIDLSSDEMIAVGRTAWKVATQAALQNVNSNSKVITKAKPAPKKTVKKQKAHVLLWVPHNGTRSNTWPKLKVSGVYSTKEKAMAERESIMKRYHNCGGHCDIMTGATGTFHDEFDIVVKPADCFFDD